MPETQLVVVCVFFVEIATYDMGPRDRSKGERTIPDVTVLLREDGKTQPEIAELTGASLSTVNRAHMAYDSGGVNALKAEADWRMAPGKYDVGRRKLRAPLRAWCLSGAPRPQRRIYRFCWQPWVLTFDLGVSMIMVEFVRQ